MLDTKGPKICSGFFASGNNIKLTKGEWLVLMADYSYKGDHTKLACLYASLATLFKVGQEILVADGSTVLMVQSIDAEAKEVMCRIENLCSLGECKNMNLPGVIVNLPGVIVDLPTLTDKDIDDIVNLGIPNETDFIAASFVRKASDVIKIQDVLGEAGKGIHIISKIENQEGMEKYDKILAGTGAEMDDPAGKHCGQAGGDGNANAGIDDSESRPTRAECSNVANAVLDGMDYSTLSRETANGQHPVAAVMIMAQTCVEAKLAQDSGNLYQAVRNSTLAYFGNISTL